jgi:putative hemolysin
MSWLPVLAVAGVTLFAAASFFFALAETALFSLGKWQARQLAQRDERRGGLVLQLLGQPQDVLATMVFGNTVAIAALVAVVLCAALEAQWSLAATLAGLLVAILLGCEVFPKTLAVRHADRWALRVARPVALLVAVSRPLQQAARRIIGAILKAVVPKTIQPLAAVTDEDYEELLEIASQQGALGQSEKEIILQIIQLDRRTAKEAMKPRAQMACISDDLTVEEMIAAARKFKHRRLPIYDETPDTIVGVLNTRTLLLNPGIDLAEAIEFPSFVPETMNLLQLFKSLQRQQRGLAIVLDEYGQTDGIITMEDILEEVVGEIRSEGEAEGFVMERIAPGKWRVNGTMRLDDFRREYPPLGDVPEVETIGGLVTSLAEVVPAVGQMVRFNGLRLTVLAADERRVREVRIDLLKKGKGAA